MNFEDLRQKYTVHNKSKPNGFDHIPLDNKPPLHGVENNPSESIGHSNTRITNSVQMSSKTKSINNSVQMSSNTKIEEENNQDCIMS